MKKYIVKNRYILLFVILLGVCSLFPYSGDDWAWGSSIGIERLEAWFDNYNGRYVGNLIVLVLTRFNVLRIVSMSFCLTGIVFCMEIIIGERWVFALGCFLLIIMPKLVLRQAVVWTSGFSNYTTSIFLVLVYIAYNSWLFYPKEQQVGKRLAHQPVHAVFLFGLGVANTLIVEHITIYNVILGLVVLVYMYAKYRKVLIQHICFWIGSILGSIYMFSNEAYHSITENVDTYRTIASGGVFVRAIKNYVNVIYSELYMNNLWLNAFILIVCILLYYSLKNIIKEKRISNILFFCLCVISAYYVWSVFSVVSLAEENKSLYLLCLEGFGTMVGASCLILFSIFISIERKRLEKMLLYIGSILSLSAPLFVVTPVGSRCFLATYVFLVMFLMELLKMLLDIHYKKKAIAVEIINAFCLLGCCIGFVFYSYIYGSIHRTDINRLEHVREEISKGKTQVELIHYPYESFLWCATPSESTDIWAMRYKLFYGIPEEIELIPVKAYSTEE